MGKKQDVKEVKEDRLSELDALRLALANSRLTNLRNVMRQQEAQFAALAGSLGLKDGDHVDDAGRITRVMRVPEKDDVPKGK